MKTMLCHCSADKTYENCCGRFHSRMKDAENAETLMRSRYSAYVLKLEDYLLATWHPSTRPVSLDFSDSGKTKWLGLQIKQHTILDDYMAQVEFIARYRTGGQSAVRLHEISDFSFENGRWFYVSGTFPA
jgi:SEC-C motif domain protein